jgi:hypothetical protein
VKSILKEVAQHLVTAFNSTTAVAQRMKTCNQYLIFVKISGMVAAV